MLKLVYSADELMASHPFAQFHEAAGHKLHGGFDTDGAYTPPRSLHRWPAIHAWQAEVERYLAIIAHYYSLPQPGEG